MIPLSGGDIGPWPLVMVASWVPAENRVATSYLSPDFWRGFINVLDKNNKYFMITEPERRYFSFSNSRDVRHGALPKEDPGHYGRTKQMLSVQAMNCFSNENDTVSG